ncbi:MAG: alpha/beta hydrolase fold domain-containing protein [Clostridia bacterium]|nr:alpha/beta hydrolase fold domain-containing protein [Clostridia bacterium]
MKIIKRIDKHIEKIKLSYSKMLTSVGLKIFTHNKKIPNVCIKKDIAYGTSKLQKFDLIYPVETSRKKLPVCFYVHGGSWCGGDKYGYNRFCGNLAKQEYLVVNLNYRLMPKVSVKTCVADCIKAIRFFMQNAKSILKTIKAKYDLNFDDVYMLGDSAGAHIVSLIAAKQTSGKIKLKINISALGLYYGVYNFEGIAHDPSPIMTDLDKYWKSVCDDTKTLYKEISTTTYVTEKFPATFMTSGEIDKLHFQSEVLARLLKYNSVELEYLSFEKSRRDGAHAFLNAPFLKSAKEAFATLSDFFEKHRKQ